MPVDGRLPEVEETLTTRAWSDARRYGSAARAQRTYERTLSSNERVQSASSSSHQLDVLVNNVGAARVANWWEVDDGGWMRTFELNVLAYVRCSRAALPRLRASDQARIVNVASTSGKRPSTGMPDYSVTKASVLSFSRLLADAHAREGSSSTRSARARRGRRPGLLPAGWPIRTPSSPEAIARPRSPPQARDARSRVLRSPTRSRA